MRNRGSAIFPLNRDFGEVSLCGDSEESADLGEVGIGELFLDTLQVRG